MILVKTYKKDNEFEKITITGHANYQEFGRDIVCAAVSSMAICTINAIYAVENNLISVEEKSGFLEITILKQNKIAMILLENLIRCLKDLEQDYPTNIKIK